MKLQHKKYRLVGDACEIIRGVACFLLKILRNFSIFLIAPCETKSLKELIFLFNQKIFQVPGVKMFCTWYYTFEGSTNYSTRSFEKIRSKGYADLWKMQTIETWKSLIPGKTYLGRLRLKIMSVDITSGLGGDCICSHDYANVFMRWIGDLGRFLLFLRVS